MSEREWVPGIAETEDLTGRVIILFGILSRKHIQSQDRGSLEVGEESGARTHGERAEPGERMCY